MDTNKYKVFKHPMVNGTELYQWPEFQAFAERLGIEYGNPTLDINIFIPLKGIVIITQEYYGIDTKVLKKPVQSMLELEVTKEDMDDPKLQQERQRLQKQIDALGVTTIQWEDNREPIVIHNLLKEQLEDKVEQDDRKKRNY